MKVFCANVLFISLIILSCESYKLNDRWNTTWQDLELPPGVPNNFYQVNLATRITKIVFGETATSLTQFPYQALIFITRPTVTVQCGGAVISDTWIISARHCVIDALSIELRIGDNSRYNYAIKVYASGFAKSDAVDASLIQVRTQIKFTSFVNYIRLPTVTQALTKFVDNIATVSGYGVTNTKTNTLSDYLQFTSLKIITNEECALTFGSVDPLILCAVGYPNPKSSSCPGDSGSPLVVYENGTPTLVGIVSYGAAPGCDLGYPVGYYRVASQLEWIRAYTGIPSRS
ncbi:unnamed protein product [Diamesa hyperborea]